MPSDELELEHQGADVDEHQGAAAADDGDEAPLSAAERARIQALCWCGHAPAAHPAQDARCDVPRCPCRSYRRVVATSPVQRTTL